MSISRPQRFLREGVLSRSAAVAVMNPAKRHAKRSPPGLEVGTRLSDRDVSA